MIQKKLTTKPNNRHMSLRKKANLYYVAADFSQETIRCEPN